MEEVINRLQEWAKSNHPVPPGVWIDESMKLLAFIGEESDRVIELEHQVALEKWNYKSTNKSSDADAESYKKTLDVYKELQRSKEKVALMDKYILLAKKRATLASDEIKY